MLIACSRWLVVKKRMASALASSGRRGKGPAHGILGGRYRWDVRLDFYRSCSWREKREVLDAFWRAKTHPSNRINDAALEYGPYAALLIALIVLELVPIIIFTIARANAWGWVAGVVEAGVVASLGRAVVRIRKLKSESSTRLAGANF